MAGWMIRVEANTPDAVSRARFNQKFEGRQDVVRARKIPPLNLLAGAEASAGVEVAVGAATAAAAESSTAEAVEEEAGATAEGAVEERPAVPRTTGEEAWTVPAC